MLDGFRVHERLHDGGMAASRTSSWARARGSSALRRYLVSVSARVAAEAPCTVTVVRGELRA